MKNQHLTTSTAVNRELAAMSEQKAVTKKDYSRAIILITVCTIASLITAFCVVFGVNLN